jgi:hypothetical protein
LSFPGQRAVGDTETLGEQQERLGVGMMFGSGA